MGDPTGKKGASGETEGAEEVELDQDDVEEVILDEADEQDSGRSGAVCGRSYVRNFVRSIHFRYRSVFCCQIRGEVSV